MNQFALYPVEVGQGTVALSPVPGHSGDYASDLAVVVGWRPDIVISMTSGAEMQQAGAATLEPDLRRNGVEWVHLPVVDFGVPDLAVEAAWPDVGRSVALVLHEKRRVLVHCRGGCGRSGMIALRLMIEHGKAPKAALARLRSVRPCAVETDEQFRWAAQAVRPPQRR